MHMNLERRKNDDNNVEQRYTKQKPIKSSPRVISICSTERNGKIEMLQNMCIP